MLQKRYITLCKLISNHLRRRLDVQLIALVFITYTYCGSCMKTHYLSLRAAEQQNSQTSILADHSVII